VWLAVWNLFAAKSYFRLWESESRIAVLSKKLAELERIFAASGQNLVSASYLKRRLIEAEFDELRFPPAIFLILDTAMARQSLTWNVRQAGDALGAANPGVSGRLWDDVEDEDEDEDLERTRFSGQLSVLVP
jgi:hypothetical protein